MLVPIIVVFERSWIEGDLSANKCCHYKKRAFFPHFRVGSFITTFLKIQRVWGTQE